MIGSLVSSGRACNNLHMWSYLSTHWKVLASIKLLNWVKSKMIENTKSFTMLNIFDNYFCFKKRLLLTRNNPTSAIFLSEIIISNIVMDLIPGIWNFLWRNGSKVRKSFCSLLGTMKILFRIFWLRVGIQTFSLPELFRREWPSTI